MENKRSRRRYYLVLCKSELNDLVKRMGNHTAMVVQVVQNIKGQVSYVFTCEEVKRKWKQNMK